MAFIVFFMINRTNPGNHKDQKQLVNILSQPRTMKLKTLLFACPIFLQVQNTTTISKLFNCRPVFWYQPVAYPGIFDRGCVCNVSRPIVPIAAIGGSVHPVFTLSSEQIINYKLSTF